MSKLEDIEANQPASDAVLNIRTLSNIAKWCACFGIMIIVLSGLVLAFMFFVDSTGLESIFEQQGVPEGTIGELPIIVRLVVLNIALASMLPALVGFFTATRLFSSFGEGVIFNKKAAERISLIGWIIVIIPLTDLLTSLAISGALLFFKTTGKVSFSVDFDEGDMMAIVFGLLFVILGRIVAEAVKISDENRQFI